jgi:hypothetical protein
VLIGELGRLFVGQVALQGRVHVAFQQAHAHRLVEKAENLSFVDEIDHELRIRDWW